MLEGILGNATAEKVLLYLEQYGRARRAPLPSPSMSSPSVWSSGSFNG